jgi:aldose 1-epimerase
MSLTTQTVTSPNGTTVAQFVPGAAMLCCSWRVDGDELLDAGKGVEAYATRGATMAIPLLYPWANRLAAFDYTAAGRKVSLPDDRARIPADPNGLPIHGVVPGLIRFECQPAESQAQLTATLRWEAAELLELFPFRHEVGMQVTAGESRLTIATTVRATGQDAVPVSFGFHPYLRLPGSSRTSWQLQLPPADHLLLDERSIPTGEREPAPAGPVPLGESSWDDAFKPHTQAPRYTVSDGERRISLEFEEGFAYSQVYAPPGKDFVCFEPMTAPTDALRSGDGLSVVEPGGEHRGVFTVRATRDS